jgi:predicted RecA/RadA family phage recombinase
MAANDFEAQLHQDGRYLDHTPVADVAAGTVVFVGAIAAVAPLDIAADTLGALDTEGVYKVIKTLAATPFAAGDEIDWDGSGAVAGAAGDRLGRAVYASAVNDTHVFVKLNLV